MLALGFLSLMQVTFLPGFLILIALGLNSGFIRTAVLSFPLSLVVNHILVFLLTSIGLYSRTSIFVIFVVEVCLFFWLSREALEEPFDKIFQSDRDRLRDFLSYLAGDGRSFRIINWLIYSLALGTFLYFAIKFMMNLGEVFSGWDAVVSWNRWAVDWYQGNFPSRTWHYPQLLPAVWSITYKFIGTSSVQFFPKAIMPLFPLFTLLVLFDLAMRRKDLGYLMAISVVGFVFTRLVVEDVVLFGGYADVPVAFMAFVAVYTLLEAGSGQPEDLKKKLWLGAFLAGGAALTKQAGLTLIPIYVLLTYLLVIRNSNSLSRRDKIMAILMVLLIIAAVSCPWYVFTEMRISQGLESSEVSNVANAMHKGRTHWYRLFSGIELIRRTTFDPILVLGLLCIAITCVRNRDWRHIILTLAVPFFFIWAFFFSYSVRNLTLIFPFIGTAAGLAIPGLCSSLSGVFKRLGEVKSWAFVAGVILLGTALSFVFNAKYLESRQVRLQMNVGTPFINQIIYDYKNRNGLKGKIITDYQILEHLPGLSRYYVKDNMTQIKSLLPKMQDPEMRYLLFTKPPPSKMGIYIDNMIYKRQLEQIYLAGPVMFFEIRQ